MSTALSLRDLTHTFTEDTHTHTTFHGSSVYRMLSAALCTVIKAHLQSFIISCSLCLSLSLWTNTSYSSFRLPRCFSPLLSVVHPLPLTIYTISNFFFPGDLFSSSFCSPFFLLSHRSCPLLGINRVILVRTCTGHILSGSLQP